MGWARLDDGFHDHPKVDSLSLSAVGLYTLCLTWAHRHRKSAIVPGHITEARVKKLAGRQAESLAVELMSVNLWESEPNLGGYVIHDFEDYLPKDRDPEERREAGKRGAQNRWQRDSKQDGNLPSSTDANLPSDSMATDSSRASAPASPSRPVPSRPQSPSDSDPTSSGARKRATRLPDDWKPTPTDIDWQRTKGIDDLFARRALEKFGNYWRAKGGSGSTKLDWSATWRNWLLTEQERNPQQAQAATPGARPAKYDAAWEAGM